MSAALPQAVLQFEKVAERFYRPELDLTRFLAFCGVFLFHSAFFTKLQFPFRAELAGVGAYGMCLFFFLSAYLITELLTRERDKSGTIHIRAFFIRRILRIWPLYFGFIVFTLLLGFLVPRFHIDPQRVAALTLLSGNWYAIKHGPDPSPAGPLWSISLEEQFYLVWPLLAKWRGGRRLGVIAALLLAVGYSVVGSQHGVGGELDPRIWFNSFVQFQFFALGALTSLLLRHRSPAWNSLVRILLLVTGVCAWSLSSWVSRLPYPHGLPGRVLIFAYGLMSMGCLCIFLGLLGISCHLVPKWLAHLGQISYGLYVFHILALSLVYLGLEDLKTQATLLTHAAIFDVSELTVALTLTVLAATLSYRFFEYRFLRLKGRFTFIESRPVGLQGDKGA